MLSKLFTKTLRSTVTRAVLQKKQLHLTVFKAMATNEIANVDKGKQKLLKALSREIKFEEENYKVDESAKEFLNKNGFSLRDQDTDNTVELTKKVGNATVEVVFQSRPPEFNEEPEGGEEEGSRQKEGEEEGGQYDEGNIADFTVYIAQANGKALTFECTSYNGELHINFVSVVNDIPSHKKGSRLERPDEYSADFSSLDERLQNAFTEYLRGFGITEEVGLFVEHYSQDKDQRQYMKWLKDLSAFVEKPVA